MFVGASKPVTRCSRRVHAPYRFRFGNRRRLVSSELEQDLFSSDFSSIPTECPLLRAHRPRIPRNPRTALFLGFASASAPEGGVDKTSYCVAGILCCVILGLAVIVVLATVLGNYDVDDSVTEEPVRDGVTTTTTPPPPLLCSVGTAATTVRTMLPHDGDCDILIYTHVQVINQTVHAVVNDKRLQTFQAVCATYSRTTCGLSFSMQMLKADTFSDMQVQDAVKELQQRDRIHNLGILDVYGSREEVDNASTTIVPGVLAAMRQLLGDDAEHHKVFVGLGYYYYNGSDSWNHLSRTAQIFTPKAVDIIVVISTILSVPSFSECMTLATNALASQEQYTPNMESAFLMAKDTFGRSEASVIMNKPGRRVTFSWFLLNVELTDVTRQCLTEGPFQRVKEFKEFYVNEAQKTAAG
ncbi:hypothetical protein MTO96_007120 [Rhipicephalus appendiculatus]